MRPEPHLEATQDLELLAQEIAEAAVEEERRSSNTSSPTPSQSQVSEMSCELISSEDTKETISVSREGFEVEEPVSGREGRQERGRSHSPVDDEASWEIVDAEEEHPDVTENDVKIKPAAEQNSMIVRKFIGSHDLWQKLKEIGMVCDACSDYSMDSDDNSGGDNNQPLGVNNLLVSCSESMVICDMPQGDQQAGDAEDTEMPHQLLLRDVPEGAKLPTWHGTIAGAMVVVELERLGGLLVASVRVTHTDLLSALASLQQLTTSVGLVSYADVDVPSLLARAA